MNLPKTLNIPGDSKLFFENQSICGFFGFEFSFQNCFWDLFNASGSSLICKIRNASKLRSRITRTTLIQSSEKTPWEFISIILDKKLTNKFKNGHDKFLSHKVSLKKSLNFVLENPSKKSLNHGTLRAKNFQYHF
jgi:hypothetical protein